jgi:hypothetical protein
MRQAARAAACLFSRCRLRMPVVTGILISPLAAEVDLPTISSPLRGDADGGAAAGATAAR